MNPDAAVAQVAPETEEAESSYRADAITVLEGLEAVRERPSMYIGSTGPTGLHHLVWEVVDNSVDEAMAGYCTRIDVTLHADGSCEVADNGRGIPVDPHPLHDDTPAAELVLTVLHAGGKFGGDGYKISGGLHGVGVSVVNALSSRMQVEIRRSGQLHCMAFVDGGQVHEPLAVSGPAPNGRGESPTGTAIRFWPDGSVLEDVEFRYQTVIERLEMMAFLNRGLEIRVRDLRAGPQDHSEWAVFRYDGGIVDYVSHLNQSKVRLFDAVGHFSDSETIDANPHEIEVAFQWNTGFNTDGLHSFANGISTIDGGHARAGVPGRSDPHRQRLRPREGAAQGEGRQPPG